MLLDHDLCDPVFRPGTGVIAGSQLTDFIGYYEQRTGLLIADSAALQRHAVREFRTFWRHFLTWSEIAAEGPADPVCLGDDIETARFFPDLALNYAENLLRVTPGDDRPAITCCHASGASETLSRRDLRRHVLTLAAWLRANGIGPGDRVAAVAHNNAAAVIGALAAASVGAVFSSASPDMGAAAILSRLRQLSPKVLLAHTAGTAPLDREAVSVRVGEVVRGLPSLQVLIVLDDGHVADAGGVVTWRLSGILSQRDPGADAPPVWPRFPFNHPLFILFSSGTTGKPKCIVHGAGGTLLEHVKEHRLHGDLRADDRLFFQTSTAWMMWNWQLSALACGAEIVLFDGPVTGPETLWRIVAAHGVTVFGTSPSFLKLCEDAGYEPENQHSLAGLRAMLSTGSVLNDHHYDWCRDHVGSLPLQSICGGTDIIGCFVLGNPNAPVWRGEAQCVSFGLDARAVDERGQMSAAGELVCVNPFPSRPVGFFGDDDGTRFHGAYFQQNPGMWTHGDLIEFTASGGARLHGRSDGVMNIDGVRIGPAEIYALLQGFVEIHEAMAVEQQAPDRHGGSRLVLLLVPRVPGSVDHRLRARIRKHLAREASPAHVPARIIEVAELPVTFSGKRSERAVRDALDRVAGGNTEALRNPACLVEICRQVELEDSGFWPDRTGGPANGAEQRFEDRVRSIWERVLGFRDVDADDGFFELGGSSIMALRLCQDINERLGVAIGPWILFYAPTLRGLTLALDGTGTALSPVAPLKPAGADLPVFLLPGIFGDVMELRALSGQMHCPRPLFGLRARGLAPGETPHHSVEAIADDHLEHLRRLQPAGPYRLIGYSFGGLIAYEMACRLREARDEVAFLGLIDTDLHHACLRPAEQLRYWIERALGGLRVTVKKPREAWGIITERLFAPAVPPVVKAGGMDFTMPPLLRYLAGINGRAFARYRPRPYDGSVTIFRAAERRRRFCEPLLVWRHLVGGPIGVKDIPGSHDGLMLEPAASHVARDLDALLEVKAEECRLQSAT